MKNKLLVLLCLAILGCSRNDNINNCNFLLNVGVNTSINLNLPQFSQLINTGNSVRLEGQGNGGLIITRVNSSTIRAWDAADPNHTFENCSILTINGINAVCGCADANEYSLITGQVLNGTNQPCTLKEYRVEFVGNNQYVISN
ncbi:hypothetical protein [Winogradskyella jejuensis]|uniref:Ferredoxin subunit of nitrite reductase or a ring-hydroxylating dioxygenase n=1 Tax=Winogradskyella jejuensis TaxID=1089305 RepID=A0A1M5NYX0_9FLAO|nr:hypothetical protein [Winogradskyella jejuensis]SHG94766.1 hypothetical protein SAMN05444148_1335 [Winogradskyella jejuensis]